MDQMNPLPGRMTHRLNLDSSEEQRREEEERIERQEYERQKEEKRKRKQEKRRAKQEQQKEAKLRAQRQSQKRKKEIQTYNDPAKLFQSDSSSGADFPRVKRKINEMYPKYAKKRRESSSEQEQSEDESEEESEESGSSSTPPKTKKTKKIEKRRHREEESISQRKPKVKGFVKTAPELSAKDKLVQEVAVRWWYALDSWPPEGYNYDQELKKIGYRLVKVSDFKFVDEVVNGMTKVMELDGYPGVFKSKQGLVDVRPKESAPTISYFENMNQEQLNELLKKALQKQAEELKNVEFKQSGEAKLLVSLERKINSLR